MHSGAGDINKLSLDKKMELAYGIKLHALEEVLLPKPVVKPKSPFRQRAFNTLAFWRDDMAIMLLVSSLAIMAYMFPPQPFDLTVILAWFIAFLLVFVPVALVFTWLIMIGFKQRKWTFVRVFSSSLFFCLAFLCFIATYFP